MLVTTSLNPKKPKLHPLQLISKGTSNGQLFELDIIHLETGRGTAEFLILSADFHC